MFSSAAVARSLPGLESVGRNHLSYYFINMQASFYVASGVKESNNK